MTSIHNSETWACNMNHRYRLANLVSVLHARVKCPEHGTVSLTEHEYYEQLMDASLGWHCPQCHKPATFDDEHWAEAHFAARRGDFEDEEH